jgi:hypothetical protein
MSRRETRCRNRGIVTAIALLLILKSEGAHAGAEEAHVTIGDPAALSGLSGWVSRAVRDARAKLGAPDYRRILSDYRDSIGRTLLAENPPSSQAITARVISRCGR